MIKVSGVRCQVSGEPQSVHNVGQASVPPGADHRVILSKVGTVAAPAVLLLFSLKPETRHLTPI